MRILCIPYSYTLSHISRLLLVTEVLRNQGHEIVYAGKGEGTLDVFIEKEGYPLVPIYQVRPEDLFARIGRGDIKFVTAPELEQMVESDRQVYRDVKPDLVLSDGRFSAPISTGIDNIRHAAIVNVSSTAYRALPYIPFFGWLPFKSSLLDQLNLKLEMLIFDNLAGEFKKWSAKHHLSNQVTATNCLTGKDLTLMPDIPEYFPTRNLPDNYHYVGPLTWKAPGLVPDWWPPKPRDGQKLVYITMGTTWVGGSFEKLYQLVRAHGLQAIITTGGQTREMLAGTLQTIPGEIYIEDYIDGSLVLEAADLVVCHGGNGTIYQALEKGRPIIGIPTIPDQEFNMRRVEALQLGKRVDPKDFHAHPERLFEAIAAVLGDPLYRQNAERFARQLSTLDPPRTAAGVIDRVFNRQP